MQIVKSIINREYLIFTAIRFKKVFIRSEKFKVIVSFKNINSNKPLYLY
jgi:hypothetical protein